MPMRAAGPSISALTRWKRQVTYRQAVRRAETAGAAATAHTVLPLQLHGTHWQCMLPCTRTVKDENVRACEKAPLPSKGPTL